jgi:pilus assembly protein CpaC
MKLLLLISLIAAPASAEELWLKVGEVRRLPAPAGKAVRIASRGIVKVIDGAESVRVVGLKPGLTPMVIGERNYQVHVSFGSQRDFVRELRNEVGRMKGIQLALDDQTPAIQGTLLRFSDWRRLAELSIRYGGEYRFMARALPDVGAQAIAHLRRIAREKGFPIVRFASDPQFIAQVPRAAGALRELAGTAFKPYGIQVQATESDLLLQPLVRTRVVLAEVSRSDAIDFGVQWPAEYSAQLLPRFQADDALMVSLHALEEKGKAQILASPNLICRSGGEAKFHAGGEFPIKIFSRFTHDVVWKEHGVLLSVKPEADFHGAISLDLKTEVSMLDMANAVDKIPALKTNTVQSHFDLPGRRTIALSGLLRQELGDSREGLPLLASIPVLGALFSSQKFIRRQSELVIFVTPEIYTPDHDEKIEMPEGWTRDAFE